MKYQGGSLYQPLLSASGAVALFALLACLPGKASALDVASQTRQILPPGPNTCAPIQVSNFTPYIYDNALNSFEFTVSDASYVAIMGSIGNTSIPLHFMTRLASPSGGIRIHVDVDTTPLAGSVPVTVTLLSASTGHPLCASVIATSLGSGPVGTYTPSAQTPATSMTPAPVTHATSKSVPSSGGNAGMGAVVAPPAAPVGVTQNPFKNLCTSDASAFRLWLIILVLYALVVGGLLWLEFPMSWSWAQTPERVATGILFLLILILGFWYLSVACRAALWMPLVAFLIAILGLLAAFWNHPKVTRLLLIEEKKSVIITPPPAKK